MGAVVGGGIVPGEARTVDVGGFTVVVHAGAGMTSGAFSLIETVEAIAGSGPPLHVHRVAAESFYVIEGEYASTSTAVTSAALRVHSSTCPGACRIHSGRVPSVAGS